MCLNADCVHVCVSLSGMDGERTDSSLDLSHLTDQEQSIILQVLQRDQDLRRRDEGRVRWEASVFFLPLPVTTVSSNEH